MRVCRDKAEELRKSQLPPHILHYLAHVREAEKAAAEAAEAMAMAEMAVFSEAPQ